MARARSGSIFCWPRAVVFFLLFLRALAYFDLLLLADAAVLDFGCEPAAAFDAEWVFAVEVERACVPFAEADTCFRGLVSFALAVFDFAVFDFAIGEFAALDFGVVPLVLPVLEPAAGSCPSAVRGEAQAHISASAQPAPSNLRIFARCFRFGSKGNPQKISGQCSVASKIPHMILPHSLTTD